MYCTVCTFSVVVTVAVLSPDEFHVFSPSSLIPVSNLHAGAVEETGRLTLRKISKITLKIKVKLINKIMQKSVLLGFD